MRYEVNSSGFVRSCLGRADVLVGQQCRVSKCYPTAFGCSAIAEPGLFDAWTAIFVPWGKHGEEVLAVVRDQVKVVQVCDGDSWTQLKSER